MTDQDAGRDAFHEQLEQAIKRDPKGYRRLLTILNSAVADLSTILEQETANRR